jgi:hypothetical protein
MRPLLFVVRVLVKIDDQEVEKIAVSHDDDTDAIQVLRPAFISQLPASGFTYVPQGAPFDTYEKGQWRMKPDAESTTRDPVEALRNEMASGEKRRKIPPGKAGEPRQAWDSLFTVASERLPREIRSGEEICYQCVRKYFDDPVPKGLQPASKVASERQCALCGAPLKPTG